jgi:valyl-tRNA synthetase
MLHVEIDKSAEKARLEKQAAKVEAEIANARGKLSNPTFVEKAPAALVEQEKKRLSDREAELAQIRAQIAKLG